MDMFFSHHSVSVFVCVFVFQERMNSYLNNECLNKIASIATKCGCYSFTASHYEMQFFFALTEPVIDSHLNLQA